MSATDALSRIYATWRRLASWRNQWLTWWFQLAKVRLTSIPQRGYARRVTRRSPARMCSASGLWPNSARRRPLTHAAADGHMNAASGRDIQTRPEAPREADRDGAMSAAGAIPPAA